MLDEALDSILRLLCSGDEANEALALMLAESQGIDLEPLDWDFFLLKVPAYANNRLAFPKRLRFALKQLHGRSEFRLHSNGDFLLDKLPRALPYFPNLRQLFILHTSDLRQLPEWLGDIAQLDMLTLQFLQNIEALPRSLSKIPTLREIHLRDCPQLKLDEDAVFPRLEVLSIQHCDAIQSLPRGLEQSLELRELTLARLPLEQIPSFLSHCPRLNALELNHLFSLADQPIRLASSLRHFQLKASKLEHFPAFENSQQLTYLDLQQNQIRRLPEKALAVLPRLESLKLSNNQLDKLPDAIGSLSSLRWLELNDNQLRELPTALTKCKKLERLELKNNPFNPKEIHRWRKMLPKCRIVADY